MKPEALTTAGAEKLISGKIRAAGFRFIWQVAKLPSLEQVEQHYAVHRDQPYFRQLVDDIVDHRIVLFVVEHDADADDEQTVIRFRNVMGPFKEGDRLAGTIRGDLMKPGDPANRNFIHGADSAESYEREREIWFHGW